MKFLKRHKWKSLLAGLVVIATVAYAAGFERIPKDTLLLGTGSSSTKTIEFDLGLGSNNPKLRGNAVSPQLEFASDGVSFLPFGSGSGGASGINVISNGDFELGVASNWTASGGTLADEEGANLLNGTKSASWDASGIQNLTSDQGTLPAIVENENCIFSFWYEGGDANIVAEVIDSGSATLVAKTLSAQASPKEVVLPFKCPTTSMAVRFRATAAAAIIYIDDVFAGTRDRVRESLELISVDDPNATIAGGGVILADGRVLKTYDGTGTTSEDYGKQLTVSLDTILGGNPADATTYSLCIDRDTLAASTTLTDTGEKVVAIQEANFALLTDAPEDVLVQRYLCLGWILSNSTGTLWSGDDSAFDDYPRNNAAPAPVTVNPIIFSQSQTVGSVGAVANDQGPLAGADFPDTTTLHFYHLDTDGLDDGPNTAVDLTSVGTPVFDGKGFFGRETVLRADITNGYTSSDAIFGVNAQSLSIGAWCRLAENKSSILRCFGKSGLGGQRGYHVGLTGIGTGRGTFTFSVSVDAGANPTEVYGGSIPEGDWFHVAMVYDSVNTETTFYVNGQYAQFVDGTQHTSTDLFRLGSDINTGNSSAYLQDLFVKNDVLTEAEINAIYSKRFTNSQQIAGGHILTADSFPIGLADRAAIWNLDGLTDSSGATMCGAGASACDLTNNGATPFTGVDIFGTSRISSFDGTSQYLTSTDTALIPSEDEYWAVGGWFKTTWGAGKTTGNPNLISNRGAQDYFDILVDSATGDILCRVLDAGGNANTRFSVDLTTSEWVHILLTSEPYGAGIKTKCYLNGKLMVTDTNSGGITAAGTSNFTIGAGEGGANKFDGKIQDVFFIRDYKLTDEDITKIVSSKVNLPRSTPVDDQDWLANFTREDSKIVNEFGKGWLVSKAQTYIYVDTGLNPGDVIEMKLRDTGFSAQTVPVQKFNAFYTTDPCVGAECAINHNLPGRPSNVEVWHEVNAGEWERQDPGTCQATTTTLICDFQGIATIGASNRLNVVASMSDLASAFEGDPVTAGSQTFSGDKTFTGTSTFSGNAKLNGAANEIVVQDTCTGNSTLCWDDSYPLTGACTQNCSNYTDADFVKVTRIGNIVHLAWYFVATLNPAAGQFGRATFTNPPFVTASFPSSVSVQGICNATSDSGNRDTYAGVFGSGDDLQVRLSSEEGSAQIHGWNCQVTYLIP